MAGQIIFFKKNKADFTYGGVVAMASEGSIYAPYVLNRSNLTAWVTTGSVDANNTTLTVDMGDLRDISEVLLVLHNFKSFTVKWWDGSAYQDFVPAINPTACIDSTSWYSVAKVQTTKLQVTIFGTQIANSDKFLYQFLMTEKIAQLNGWPAIANVEHNQNKASTQSLSGKQFILEQLGGFKCDLTVPVWSDANDLAAVESVYNLAEGALVWLCGGDETQFSSKRKGYRLQDVYLMKPTNNYSPVWYKGLYGTGLVTNMKLAEVVN